MPVSASLRPVPIRSVLADATAIALSYVPFGVLFGALAERAGLSLYEASAMSLFVYSGAAQLVAAQMLAAGAAPLSIVVASAILTIRHVLMGASLSPYTRVLAPVAKLILSPLMTDESFALAWGRYRREPGAHGFFFGANLYLYATWNLSTIAGYLAGQAAPALTGLGLDLVFPLLFVAILVGMTSKKSEALAAAAGIVVTLVGRRWIAAEWMIPIAGVTAALVGLFTEKIADPDGSEKDHAGPESALDAKSKMDREGDREGAGSPQDDRTRGRGMPRVRAWRGDRP